MKSRKLAIAGSIAALATAAALPVSAMASTASTSHGRASAATLDRGRDGSGRVQRAADRSPDRHGATTVKDSQRPDRSRDSLDR